MRKKYILVAVGSLSILLGVGGLSFGVVNGTVPLSSIFVESLRQGTPPDVPGDGATTTPLAVQGTEKNTPPQAQVPSQPGKRAYGALMRTYADAKHGFSMKYPDELHVLDAGDRVTLSESSDKGFSLGICNPESMCGRTMSDIAGSVTSLADFERGYTITDADGLPYRIIPIDNTLIPLQNGVKVLKQTYRIEILDSQGKDITATQCEECAGTHRHYILFKKPGDYIEIRAGRLNDPDLEVKIIQSISY